MRRRLPAIGGGLFVALVTLSLLLRGDSRELSPSSYGVTPSGFGALHDVLVELGVPVRRSFASPAQLAPDATVWWIEPYDLCEKLSPADAPEPGDAPAVSELETWLRAGGTAIWFSSELAHCEPPVRIAGLDPPRAVAPAEDAPESDVEASEEALVLPEPDEVEPTWITGSLVPRPRQLPEPPQTFGAVPEPFRVIARTEDGVLAVEAIVGQGRLILVSDAYFLRNFWLDRDDAALLAMDWVRVYGVPVLDEREHGFLDMPSTLAYLAGSSALPVFAGLGATGLLFAWAGAALPRRRVGDTGPEPPTLATYVDSLARLYARTGEHAEVYERYRAFALAELRRTLFLPHDAPSERVLDALRARGIADADTGALRGEESVGGQAELDAACAAIDRLLARVG